MSGEREGREGRRGGGREGERGRDGWREGDRKRVKGREKII